MIGAICISFGTSKLFKLKSNKVEEYVYISRVNSSNKEDKAVIQETTSDMHKENKVEITEVEESKEKSIANGEVNESTNMITEEVDESTNIITEEVNESTTVVNNVIYNGMTLEDVSSQLNRSLTSTLSGHGEYIASYSIERGVDPYLATAIMLHETGCSWNCSSLVVSCNNVGGMKGSPSCGGGSYRYFSTLDEGIKAFIDNLADNYYAYGLTTPELMNSRYAESTTWAMKVNTYISKIKSN